jgi:hypothetical protein
VRADVSCFHSQSSNHLSGISRKFCNEFTFDPSHLNNYTCSCGSAPSTAANSATTTAAVAVRSNCIQRVHTAAKVSGGSLAANSARKRVISGHCASQPLRLSGWWKTRLNNSVARSGLPYCAARMAAKVNPCAACGSQWWSRRIGGQPCS